MPIDLSDYMKNGNEAFDKGNFAIAKMYYGYGCDRAKDDLNMEIFRYWYALSDYKLGNYHLALRNFQFTLQNLDILKKMKYPYEYQIYYSMAGVYEGLGQWVNTKKMLENALQTDHVKEKPDKKMFVVWYLGDVHREREEFTEALNRYNEAKDYFTKKENNAQILNLDIDIAKLQFKEGKVKEPLQLMQTTWKQIITSEKYAYLRDNATITLSKLVQQAIEQKIDDPLTLFNIVEPILKEELAGAESSESFSYRVECLAWLSRLSRLVGKTEIFTKSEALAEEFEPEFKRFSKEYSLADLKNLVQIYMDLGHFYYEQITEPGPNIISFKALDFYKKTDFLVDKATGRLMSPTPRREFHVQFTEIAYRIFALYQTIYQEFWEDFLYEGLGIIEKYKGYDLFLSLEAAEGRQKFLTQIDEVEYDILMKKKYLKEEADATAKEQLRNDLEKLEQKYFDIENEMVIKYSSWPTVTDPVKLMEETMGTIFPLIDFYKYGLLYFAMNENILYIIAFTKNEVQREVIEFDKKNLAELEELLTFLRKRANMLGDKADFIKFDKLLKKMSDWVSKRVITPKVTEILSQLEYLTIIPSGFFINFPLEILKIGDEYVGTKFKLSREFNLKFVAKQLVDIQWHKRQRKPQLDLLINEKDVILIGNPNYEEYLVLEKSKIEPYSVGKDKIAQTKEDLEARQAKGEEVYLASKCWLMDLGKTEVRDLAKLFKRKKIKYNSLIDTEVSKEKLLELLNDVLKIFHFAGHALFDDENPQFSQLVLRDNKVMTALEFHKYSFDQNPLLVFSACESGVSEVKKGDEPFGFLRFAKIMQAQNIIFSLWPVLSEPTTELMKFFYERLLEGHEIAEAMRYAREKIVNMIENEEGLWFFKELTLLCWAPFSFIGFPFFAYSMEVPK